MSGQPYQSYPGYSGQHQPPGYPPAPSPLQPGWGAQRPPQQQSPYSPSPFGQQAYNQQYNRPPPPPPQPHLAYGQQPSPFPNGSYPNQAPPYPPHPGHGYGGQQQPPQGYPPQQAQQQYGGAPPQQAGPAQIGAYKQILQACIQENNLQSFYPPNSPMIDRIAQRAVHQIDQVCGRWRIPKEVGNDLAKLGLFDIILYIDDSGSMQFEENGERISDLKLILQRVAYAATLFDDDGISVRFMNSAPPHNLINGIRSDVQVEQLMSGIQFKGLTPMGTELKNKVIDGIVFSQQLRKPVLVITITDGQPAGEAQNAVFETIKYAVDRARSNQQYGPGAIKFQFAQVGNDAKAREFLGKLDEDPTVGNLVDCTSNFENESDEMSRANPPINLTPELWLVKLLLGAIDRSYDRKDEKSNPPPGQYGGYQPPQQGYSQMPPGYNQPPQGYHAPPQQGYNPPQNWNQQGPPGQYPPQQQGGYGAPPPGQYGYGGPPGQYGGPPPPRR